MQSAVFGRKGQPDGTGETAQPTAAFGRKGEPDEEMARKREAFIQAERARAAAGEGDFGTGDGPGLTAAAAAQPAPAAEKSKAMAYLLWFLACTLSAHRFYLGAYRSAVTQVGGWVFGWLLVWMSTFDKNDGDVALVGMLIMVAASIWMLLDVFFIPDLYRKAVRPRPQNALGSTFA
ncbi:TM2 domain-containing protein [Parasphingopyxis marina]|uniref:TM2 domain-containing protein n=1 Tax=Parasphingopyxis marina TaxID=2761622 RepID=A0A842HYJ2_9SPHN|nr:TM2 domain-containing protein [Parasphingopyxis marina]MBC2777421.1 TM2 domain-containing protein [Parasphingopyxis marina]